LVAALPFKGGAAMIFDKNESRIKELTRKDARKYSERIAELTERGPEWWVMYYDSTSKRHAEKCPEEFQKSRKLAQVFERQVLTSIDKGEHIVKEFRVVTIADLCDFYITDKMKKSERTGQRGGLSAAKTMAGAIKRHLGHYSFDALCKKPEILVALFDDFPEKSWSQKTIWNFYVVLRRVINLWIDKKLLTCRNPLDAVDTPPQNIRVMDYVPTQADYDSIIMACITEGLPQSAINLIGAVRYTGLRIREVLGWQAEDFCLYPDDGSTPYFKTKILKQGRSCQITIPMRKELWEIIKNQLGERTGGPVWQWKNPPYGLFEIRQEDGKIKRLYDIAGVQVERPFHDFRKTFKMELKRQGLSKEITKNIMGHASDSMDDYYSHFSRVDLESAVAQSWVKPPISNQNSNQKKNGDFET
jgi:integrase